MKTKLLITTVLLTGLSTTAASGWNGFYVRTDAALMGAGHSHKKNEDRADRQEGASERMVHVSFAGGWGRVFNGNIYAGIDASPLGFSGVWNAADKNELSFLLDPKATLRLGFAKCNMLVYVGGGMGALYAFSEQEKHQGHHRHFPSNKDNKNELLFTWHGRIGVDFKIRGNWTAGMFYEYQQSIGHKNEGDTLKREDLSLISDRIAFTFGYQM